MAGYLEVVFNLPVEGPFTYLKPDDSDAGTGQRVMAPFGKRRLTGFITGEKSERPDWKGDIKPIARVIDKEPLFGRE